MSNEKLAVQGTAMEALAAGGDAPTIPKLTFKDIVDLIIEVQFQPIFDDITAQAESAEEAAEEIKETKNRLVKYFSSGAAKIEIENKIAAIKQALKEAWAAIKAIPKAIKTMISKNLVPPTIPIPTAPGVSNPIRDFLSNKENVEKLKTTVGIVAGLLITLFAKASEVSLALPQSIIDLANQIGNLNSIISKIPVG